MRIEFEGVGSWRPWNWKVCLDVCEYSRMGGMHLSANEELMTDCYIDGRLSYVNPYYRQYHFSVARQEFIKSPCHVLETYVNSVHKRLKLRGEKATLEYTSADTCTFRYSVLTSGKWRTYVYHSKTATVDVPVMRKA